MTLALGLSCRTTSSRMIGTCSRSHRRTADQEISDIPGTNLWRTPTTEAWSWVPIGFMSLRGTGSKICATLVGAAKLGYPVVFHQAFQLSDEVSLYATGHCFSALVRIHWV